MPSSRSVGHRLSKAGQGDGDALVSGAMDDCSAANSAKTGIEQDSIYWRKSSLSTFNGNCLEVAKKGDYVLVQNSRNPGPMLQFSSNDWAAFIDRIKQGNL
jgi:hypothetical protein